jgi:hypothetical protein
VTVKHDPDAFAQAHARLLTAPAELTMNDVDQLDRWNPDLGREAFDVRQKALFSPPAQDRQLAATSPDESWEDVIYRLRNKPVLYEAFGPSITVVLDTISKLKTNLVDLISQMKTQVISPRNAYRTTRKPAADSAVQRCPPGRNGVCSRQSHHEVRRFVARRRKHGRDTGPL